MKSYEKKDKKNDEKVINPMKMVNNDGAYESE